MKKLKFHLMPISRATKRPITAHGEKDASDQPNQLEFWRGMYPGCNWAIATGPSGLIAVDLDAYKPVFVDGAIEAACGVIAFPKTVEMRSARGGRVLLFKRPEGVEVSSRLGVLPAVDVKASSGYVLCPPSVNAEGQPYTWVNKPTDTPIAEAPPELVAFLLDRARSAAKKGANKPRRQNGPVEEVYLQGGDGRWEFVRRLGGILRREGCGYDVIKAALMIFVDRQCEYDETLRIEEIDRLCRWLCEQPIGVEARLEEKLIEEDGKFFVEESEGEKK